MPVLERQAVASAPAPRGRARSARPSRPASRACRRAPSPRPTRRRSRSTTSCCRCRSSILGAIAITALELGTPLGSPLVKLCVADRRAAAGHHDRRRDAPDLAVGLGVDAGRPRRGLFRLAWVVAALVGLAALIAASLRRRGARGGEPPGPPARRASCSTPTAVGRTPARPTSPSGGGVPSWLADDAELLLALRRRSCDSARSKARTATGSAVPSCGYIAYVNPRLVVTTIPVTDDGEVVLLRRGIEPGQGWWAQPGGFLEVDETVGEAAVRETLEETGLVVEPGEIVGLYSRLEAAVVVLAFEARVVGGAYRLNPEALEIQAFRPEAIPWHGIAFKTTHWALRDWVHRRRPDIHPDERHWDE